MTDTTTLDLTAQIVSAHVGKNAVEADQLPALIRSVFDALTKAGQPEPQAKVKEPAVPVKKSVFDDHIVCLESGKGFRTMRRHLKTEHGITTDEYRQRFALPRNYPLVALAYAEARAEIARNIGLGRKAGRGAAAKKAPRKKGRAALST